METDKKTFTYDELKQLVGSRNAEKAWRGYDSLRDGPPLKPHQIEVAYKLLREGSAGAQSPAALPCFTKFFRGNPKAKDQFLNWLAEEEKRVQAQT